MSCLCGGRNHGPERVERVTMVVPCGCLCRYASDLPQEVELRPVRLSCGSTFANSSLKRQTKSFQALKLVQASHLFWSSKVNANQIEWCLICFEVELLNSHSNKATTSNQKNSLLLLGEACHHGLKHQNPQRATLDAALCHCFLLRSFWHPLGQRLQVQQ